MKSGLKVLRVGTCDATAPRSSECRDEKRTERFERRSANDLTR